MMNEDRTLTLDARGRVIEQEDDSPFLTFRLSWVAYLREILGFVIRLVICCLGFSVLSLGLDHYAGMRTETWLPVLGVVMAIAWTVYSLMVTNSVRVFSDASGVWMQSGVLPWERGMTGVQWRDVGQASYEQGFLSWLCKSYHIRVSHRFTTGPELYVRNVRWGNLAVQHINGAMAELQRRILTGRA